MHVTVQYLHQTLCDSWGRWSSNPRACVMVVPLSDHPWRIKGHVSNVITIMTLNSFTELRNVYCPAQCIFIATAHVVRDTADATGRGAGITMGILLAFLRVSPSVQVCVVARRGNGLSREVKNNMVSCKICDWHFFPNIFNPTKN